jgi:hypothetical protein
MLRSKDRTTLARPARFLLCLLPALLTGFGCGPSSAAGDAGPDDAAVEDASDGTRDDAAPFDAGPRPAAALEGELSLAGCTPAVADVRVRVRKIDTLFAGSRSGGESPPPPAVIVPAVVSATADPQVFSFRVDDLVAGDLYQVGADVDDPACSDLGWRGPHAGLVMAGAAAPVRFDGLVTSSRLEVLGERPDGETWVSRDFVRSDSMMRRFRWSTELAGVTGFELQFTSDRFDVDALSADVACAPPEGLVHSQRVVHSAALPDEADIDLATVLAEPAADAGPLVRARWEQMRLHGAPLYVRAVPVTATDTLCDPLLYGTGSWVELVVWPIEETPPEIGGPPVTLAGTYDPGQGPWVDPQQGAICYTVVADHVLPVFGVDEFPGLYDAMSWSMVFLGFHPGGSTVPKGESFCYWPPPAEDSSFFDDVVEGFSDIVTGLVDAVSQAVDAIAALYEEIKGAAIGFVTAALEAVTGCPDWCHTLVRVAAESALVAMGLPPSLPNFDQLVDQGVGYLAAEIAAQTGVPAEVYEGAYDIASDIIEDAKATRGMSAATWFVEDTGFRPSSVILDVRRGSPLGTPTSGLYVRGSGPWYGVVARLFTPALGSPAIRMPLVLQPDFTGIASPAPLVPAIPPYLPAYYGHPQRVQSYYQQTWFNALVTHSCVSLRADAVTLEFPFAFVQPYADLTIFNTPGTFDDPFGHACTP